MTTYTVTPRGAESFEVDDIKQALKTAEELSHMRRTVVRGPNRYLVAFDKGKRYWFDRLCGAYVADDGDHLGLVRCFCGWSASGGDGRRELIDMGERIDDDY